MSDRLTGLVLFVLAVLYGNTARSYSVEYSDPLGPAFFPELVAVPFALFSLALVLRPDPEPQWITGRPLLKQAMTVAVMVGYALLMAPAGFILSTVVGVSVLAMLLGETPIRATLVGIAMAVGFFVLFDRVLDLPLPAGPFGRSWF
jgi:putative tricarboxylic transport membrane protein